MIDTLRNVRAAGDSIHHSKEGAGAINAQVFLLVRQYDLPSYGIERYWRLIMRS